MDYNKDEVYHRHRIAETKQSHKLRMRNVALDSVLKLKSKDSEGDSKKNDRNDIREILEDAEKLYQFLIKE